MIEINDEQARERFNAAAEQFYRYGYENGDEPINREEREQSVGRALLTLEAERDAALSRVAVLERECAAWRDADGAYRIWMDLEDAPYDSRPDMFTARMEVCGNFNDARLWAQQARSATGPLPGTEDRP